MTGTDIRTLRHRLGLSQEKFAFAVNVGTATVNRWENGHATPSRLAQDAIRRLADKRKRDDALEDQCP